MRGGKAGSVVLMLSLSRTLQYSAAQQLLVAGTEGIQPGPRLVKRQRDDALGRVGKDTETAGWLACCRSPAGRRGAAQRAFAHVPRPLCTQTDSPGKSTQHPA